jgi:queuosine precursor transporter
MIYVALYLIAIVAANISIAQFGASAAVFNAFVFIAFDLTARDALHDAWHNDKLWLKMFALVSTGSLLSALLAPPVALASFAAFMAAGAVDALLYQVAFQQPRLVRMNLSNLLSAFVDSLVFVTLAFGGVLWGIILPTYLAKVAGGLIWSFVLSRVRAK